ncbi:MAG: hypothetical protein FWE67_05970 [Planctomycetaceae bacterium]|nr:hypothetical protein [Planctomycetaceae bacterium]
MKKSLTVLSLFWLVVTVSCADKPISIAEQLGLRPIDPTPVGHIDPTPVAVALINPNEPASKAKNVIKTKDWTLTSAKFRSHGSVLELSHERGDVSRGVKEAMGYALSSSFPIKPGCYLFQIDQKTLVNRSQVTVGDASQGFFQDAMCANWNEECMTFSHFFRVSETEDQMRIGIKVRNYSKVQVKNIHLLPAQALLNLTPKGQPLQDIFWNELAVSRTEPTGVFLPLGHSEKIEQDYNTKQSVYHFRLENRVDPWGLYPERMERTVYPSVSIEARPLEKWNREPLHKLDEVILKFELRPVSIGVNGEFCVLPPLRFLSGRLQGNYVDDYEIHREGIFWSTDGKTWNAANIEIKRDMAHWPPALPDEIFPCERFYLKFMPVARSSGLSHLQWSRVQAKLDTDQYRNNGQTSYFRVVPGEAKVSGMTINPLYTARNQVYFLYRNNTGRELSPEFAARLGYEYTATFNDAMFGPARAAEGRKSGPHEVVFRASGNTVKAFDDITCHWEVLGDTDKIPPGKERICVFTLETSKLRSSAHYQREPFVSDVFNAELDLGTYKMLNEHMRFFPPRLAIE